MGKRFVLALCLGLVLAGLVGCGGKGQEKATPTPQFTLNYPFSSEEENLRLEQDRRVAQDFLEAEATFRFDGLRETLLATESITRGEGEYEFVCRFQSQHARYGDRTGMVLAQVITPHVARIVVKQGQVTSAVMDGKWDMLKQQFLLD